MIDLFYMRGEILLFDVNDWIQLRKMHRIIGDIVGSSGHIPSLPMRVTNEEALLLLEKELVSIKEIESNFADPEESLQQHKDSLLNAQIIEFRSNRKKQLESVIDKIVEKRKKLNDLRSPEEILNDELDKSAVITEKNMLWPIVTISTGTFRTLRCLDSSDILKLTTKLKSLVYIDLWNRGYYITAGDKFGGDFLVYLGDPVCYHAIFIVKCVDSNRTMTTNEFVAFGRLGTSVKKRAVLATLMNDDEVTYITVNWIDA